MYILFYYSIFFFFCFVVVDCLWGDILECYFCCWVCVVFCFGLCWCFYFVVVEEEGEEVEEGGEWGRVWG